jgi:hypothetical protein
MPSVDYVDMKMKMRKRIRPFPSVGSQTQQTLTGGGTEDSANQDNTTG